MRYQLKQKLLSWGDDYYIRDDQGREVYFVDGKALSFGGQLSFKDLEGNELAFIRQKLLKLSPTYEIHRAGQLAAVVKKELFALFHHKFAVDVPGPDDLEAKGDFLDHEYVFRRGDREVATVSKRWLTFADTYGIDIADEEDDVLILASAVVVDQACHRGDGERH
ncbi:MAG TPA: LURP-one-related family protein [Gemmatimonadaceae bacterium]|nr:LURP-one-related family protein [Gemmatimonadaceae bacterium]